MGHQRRRGPDDPRLCTDISVNAGNSINFKIKTDAHAYTIDIYRLGYYGVTERGTSRSVAPSASPPADPAGLPDGPVDVCSSTAATGLCRRPGRCRQPRSPASTSRDLTRTDTGGMSQIPFIVRNDASTSDIVYQTSDETWEAYNRYGGCGLLHRSPTSLWDSQSRARKISYNRPFATRGDSRGRDFLFSNEYPTIRFLERNGYDVSYIAGVDTDRSRRHAADAPQGLHVRRPRRVLVPGAAPNVENARNAGVNLMFLSRQRGVSGTPASRRASTARTPPTGPSSATRRPGTTRHGPDRRGRRQRGEIRGSRQRRAAATRRTG